MLLQQQDFSDFCVFMQWFLFYVDMHMVAELNSH